MSINDLSIRRTHEGHFVLVHLDKIQKTEMEKHRSADLEEVVDRLLDGHEKSSIKRGGSRDYGPVMEIIRNLFQKYPYQTVEGFPTRWTDTLELYGCLREELARYNVNPDQERKEVASLVFYKGPEWVWKNRLRLVAERVFSLSSEDWQRTQTEVS